MPKAAKIVIGVLAGYIALIVVFESLIGYTQPDIGAVLTITTTDDDGNTSDRVLAHLDDDGTSYVSANHWPRAWYREALAHPDVRVSIDGQAATYRAVPVTDDAEHARLDAKFPHPFLFKLMTGFPPREFIRLEAS